MNRLFDERMELQLQEYEFAELELPLMVTPHPVISGMALQDIEREAGRLQLTVQGSSANRHWNSKS